MKPHAIVTERLRLGALQKKDKPDLIALMQDDAVGKTYMVPDLSEKERQNALFGHLLALSGTEERVVYGIYAGDRLIGLLHDVDRKDGAIELGYALRSAFWGKGYMTEALRAVIPVLFAMGYETVKAAAFCENAASLRVMEKCGMRRTGETETVSYRGRDRLCIYCAITEKELEYRQQPKEEKNNAAN